MRTIRRHYAPGLHSRSIAAASASTDIAASCSIAAGSSTQVTTTDGTEHPLSTANSSNVRATISGTAGREAVAGDGMICASGQVSSMTQRHGLPHVLTDYLAMHNGRADWPDFQD